jgi:hypothetical protein
VTAPVLDFLPHSEILTPEAQAVQDVLELARTKLYVREIPAFSNRGPDVEMFLAFVGLERGNPWCAAFASWVIAHALPDVRLFKSGGCVLVGEWATRHECLSRTPDVGDAFLIWHNIDGGRFGHVGFVTGVNVAEGTYTTIEGNAADPKHGGNLTPAQLREGNGVYEGRARHIGPKDRFVRWTKMLPATAAKAA